MPVCADDLTIRVILYNIPVPHPCLITDCVKEKISESPSSSDCRRARGHFTRKQEDYKYVFMFVTSQVSMPAASGFIHIKYVIKQYKKTLKHMPPSLQYSYI